MSRKWVDNSDYFGPDRRRRPATRRWGERRRNSEAGDIPPVGALLRRLRVQMFDTDVEGRRRALQLLAAALSEANRLGYRRCSEALQIADRALRQPGPDVALAEAQVAEAMAHAAAGR